MVLVELKMAKTIGVKEATEWTSPAKVIPDAKGLTIEITIDEVIARAPDCETNKSDATAEF